MKKCKKVKGSEYNGNNGRRKWFGLKLCLMTGENGLPIYYEIIPASKHNINFLKLKLLMENETMIQYLKDAVITTDKAFNSKALVEEFKNSYISSELIKKGKAHHKQKER